MTDELERTTIRTVAWRLLPLVFLLYLFSLIDRVNLGFAALQMKNDLGLNDEMFGISLGIMYFTYAMFEIPSNVFLSRYGARATAGWRR